MKHLIFLWCVFALVSCGSSDKADPSPKRSSLECRLMYMSDMVRTKGCDSVYTKDWCSFQLHIWYQMAHLTRPDQALSVKDQQIVASNGRIYNALRLHCGAR